ncbi:MAG: hypothetical protein SVY53_10355 [Chloroflexota bacterium]|nr:hypothetical protein [Chloroflexota bacterium]
MAEESEAETPLTDTEKGQAATYMSNMRAEVGGEAIGTWGGGRESESRGIGCYNQTDWNNKGGESWVS